MDMARHEVDDDIPNTTLASVSRRIQPTSNSHHRSCYANRMASSVWII